MKYDIVTIGDASEDIFIRPERIKVENDRKYSSGRSATFELGEKIPVSDVHFAIGGSACNSAVSFGRLGLNVSPLVAVGEDFAARKIIDNFESENIDISNIIQKSDIETHFSVVMSIGKDRTIFVYRGLKDYSILKPKKSLRTSWIYISPLGHRSEEVFDRVAQMAAEKNLLIGWNPGHHQIDKGIRRLRAMAENTYIMFLNRSEALKFLGTPARMNVKELLKRLHQHGPEIVVITKGDEGAECYDGKRFYSMGSIECEVVDATGAGDSFASGFLGRVVLAKKYKKEIDRDIIEEAMKWGLFNAISNISKVGAQSGLLSKGEIEENIFNNPRLIVEIN